MANHFFNRIYSLPMNLQLRGTLLVAFSGILYGFIGYLGTKLFHENFTVASMLFWRFLVAAIWMSFSLFLVKKNLQRPLTTRFTLIKIFLFASITYSGGSVFYFTAIRYIGSGMGMVIFYSFPVFVILFAWLFDRWSINRYTFLSLFAVLAGLIFLRGYGDNQLDFIGVLSAMTAALFYAIYVYGSRENTQALDSRLLTMMTCFGNAIIFLLLAWYENALIIPTTMSALLYILAIGILATALPIQLLLDGLKYISPVKASILSVLEPLVTILMGLCLLNEKISSLQTIGIVFVLLGAILIQFEKTSDSVLETVK